MASPSVPSSLPPLSPLTPLPQALVHSIFTFALTHPDQRGLGAPRGSVPPELKRLARVSREWHEYAQNVASALTLRELSLPDLQIKTRRELVELRRRIVLRRAYLRALSVRDANQHATDRGVSLSLAQWRACTSHMPLLESVNLKWMTRDDASRLAAIVRAVKRDCPRLRELVLPTLHPTRTGRVSERPEHTQLLMDAVLEKTPASRSLRSLQLPVAFTSLPEPHEAAIAYLTTICDVCPNLEIVDGYTSLVDNHEQLSNDEQWHIDAVTWERFCQTCNHLKSFDWVVAPFMTTFFEIFGRYPKPKLEKLVFSTPMNWDWDRYFLRFGGARPTDGYGALARNAHAALQACPALRHLEVAVYLPGDGGDEDDDDGGFGWDVYGGMHDHQPNRVPDEPMLDQDIFGDEFCEEVARRCKQLENLTIWRVLETSSVCHSIMAFTDRAMRALATLPVLRWVDLKSVNISGDGLFALAACFAPQSESAKLQRDFVLTVGDEKGTPHEMAFYEIVEKFLERLVQCDPNALPCASRSVALRLHNGRLSSVDRAWTQAYLARVGQLAAAVKAKHPTVRLRVLTRGYDRSSQTCSDICEFGFYTETAHIQEWWGWENEPQDTRIDDVVLCRGNLYNGERPRPMRDEDEDDDEDDDDDDDDEDDEDMYDDY